MADAPEIPTDWSVPERWVWARIAAGDIADLNARDRAADADFKDLDPREEAGWYATRRLRASFLQTILTDKAFTDATPFGGVRILGALVDDALVDLEHARLLRVFWLERSRILVNLRTRRLRIDGDLSLEASLVAGRIELHGAGEVDLGNASIGANLNMAGSTFEESVQLYGATVNGEVFLRRGATFRGEVDLLGARIGSSLSMNGSTFEGKVSLGSATVNGDAFLSGGATFKGEVNLVSVDIGASLSMTGSTFDEKVRADRATVNGSAFLRGGATFKGEVDLVGASIGANLDFSDARISGEVDLSGCNIAGELRLGSSRHPPTRWEADAALVLRNTRVDALQDWWRDAADNSWPEKLQLEGFTYGQLGGLLGEGKEANMMARPVASYLQWLGRDPSSSPQRYEQLARFFRQAGEPRKANDILYEARERRRRRALAKVDDHGQAKRRDVLQWLGLWSLRVTVGYGLGSRYFRVLGWVSGLTLLGAAVLTYFGNQPPPGWPVLLFASFDQLLPIITLDRAHEVLIFGNPLAKTLSIEPQPDLVRYVFYFYKVIGWVLGSFIVAGLAGLTQRN